MASFNFTVNTTPLADRINGVTKEVGVVGGAVTALQAAVIASEREASDTICQSIDSGFYLLMRSRFSQRLAQFSSSMNSRVGSMLETAQAIDRTHQQMLGDFNRIKSRYVKLFDGLDHKLEDRVRELDRDAMNLAQTRSALLAERYCQEAPIALCCSSDTHTVALKAASAHVKTRARDSIGQLAEGAHRIVDHEATMRQILGERSSADAQESVVSVPVVYMRGESPSAAGAYVTSVIAPTSLDTGVRDIAARGVRQQVNALAPMQEDRFCVVRARFADKVADAQLDERVTRAMMRLFEASFDGLVPVVTSAVPDATTDGDSADAFNDEAHGVKGFSLGGNGDAS